jgi:DNA replication protein DnaC
MLSEPTMEQVQAMQWHAFAAAWREQGQQPDVQQLEFDERLGLLVDAEWVARESRRLTRRLQEAKLKLPQACVEGVECAAGRGIEKRVVRALGTCGWVREHQNVVLTGATGTGKTYVACALAQQACRKGYRALYRRTSRLTDELMLARADGTLGRTLERFARVDVLVLDDWVHAPLKDQERRDLLELLDDRYGTRSTVLTSQVPIATWHEALGDPTNADAICDRLLHNAHKFVLQGPSRRKEAHRAMSELASEGDHQAE